MNRINALFDVWIDVQRRWVYLEGIFSGSADIKTLLPVETQRFNSMSTEFLSLMKKVAKSPKGNAFFVGNLIFHIENIKYKNNSTTKLQTKTNFFQTILILFCLFQ